MAAVDSNTKAPINIEDTPEQVPAPASPASAAEEATKATPKPARLPTRADLLKARIGDNRKALMLGGILLIAVAFFLFVQAFGGPKKHANRTATKTMTQEAASDAARPKGSLAPGMDPIHIDDDQKSGRVQPSDIDRTRAAKPDPSTSTGAASLTQTTPKPLPGQSRPLGSVPAFNETQQHFEEPAPYGAPKPAQQSAAQEEQKEKQSLRQPSLVYVRTVQKGESAFNRSTAREIDETFSLPEGTRVQAHLQTQISSAFEPTVVAVIENTYAVGERVLVPAGSYAIGKLTNATPSGEVEIRFTEIQLAKGGRKKISAIATGLDLGPIKGEVYGRHGGRNFLVRAGTGIASTATTLVGANVNGAYSPNDQIRQRAAQNIGTAGDNELRGLNENSRVIVSVPADTKLYIVWTEALGGEQRNGQDVARADAN